MTGAQPRKKSAPTAEARRLRKFRLELVKLIPRFPNDRASLRHMQQKPLSAVLVDYIHWRARYVGKRPRLIEIEAAVKADARWVAMEPATEGFLKKVRDGDDLTPHLSLDPHTRGYSPAAHAPRATMEERWSDKDFLLTRMNYHHFHLGTNIGPAGHAERTDDLVFAEVSRDKFKVVAIFNHDVFSEGSAERRRLSLVHDEIVFRGLPPGSGVMASAVSSSGHALQVVIYAMSCGRLMRVVDPQLDDRAYVENLYALSRVGPAPRKPKFEWTFLHLDLAIYDRATGKAFIFQYGWN